MNKKTYIVSVNMSIGMGGTVALSQDLYLQSTQEDLAKFLKVLNATPEVKSITIFLSVELPALYKMKLSPESLGLQDIEKIR